MPSSPADEVPVDSPLSLPNPSMNTRVSPRFRFRPWAGPAVGVALAVLLAGCQSLEHLTALRDEQTRFSEVARRENETTLAHVLPSGAAPAPGDFQWQGPWSQRLSSGFASGPAYEAYTGYAGVYRALTALEQRAGDRLRNDQLAGNAAALRVLAFWRMTFFGHLLGLLPSAGPAVPGMTNAPVELPVPPGAMTEVVAMARRALDTARRDTNAVFPRDRFLLEAVEPLTRYDIAYLNALRAETAGLLVAPRPRTAEFTQRVSHLVEEMARAEDGLARVAGAQPLHLQKYAALARFTMLRSARTLADRANFNLGDPAMTHQFPVLTGRIQAYHEDAAGGRSPAVTAVLGELRINSTNLVTTFLPPVGR